MSKKVIFTIMLTLYFLIGEQSLVWSEAKVLHMQFGDSMKAAAYLLTFVVASIAISLALLAKQRWIRYASLLMMLFFLALDQVYLGISNRGFGYHELQLIQAKSGFGLHGQVWQTYGHALLRGLVVAIAIGITIVWFWQRIKKQEFISTVFYGPVILLALCMSYAIVSYSNANRSAFPSPVRGLSLATYMVANPLYSGPREEVKARVVPSDYEIDHIIWIIDESIRSDHLQINDSSLLTTPFLVSQQDKVINLGECVSGAVCSDYSDFMLYSGLSPEDVPDKESEARRKPSIFEYAERAGYVTCHTSAVQHSDQPQHLMTQYDYDNIDVHHAIPMSHHGEKRYNFDFHAVEALAEDLDKYPKTFTYLMKYGAHFHYEDSYPAIERAYEPTLPSQEFDRSKIRPLINSYHNSILWTVDRFFEVLDSTLADRKVLVIYTSDHGQNLFEDMSTNLTHCAKTDAPRVMANVPLILYTPDSLLHQALSSAIPTTNRDHVSHHDIYATTMQVMGYTVDKPTLFDSLHYNVRKYTSGDVFGRGAYQIYDYD